jgi:hypothetical protein
VKYRIITTVVAIILLVIVFAINIGHKENTTTNQAPASTEESGSYQGLGK